MSSFQTDPMAMPPLPDLDDRKSVEKWAIATGVWRYLFTIDYLCIMLRAYGEACAAAAVVEEREACAIAGGLAAAGMCADKVRAAIRARGET